jgi:hypothetical protein
LTCKIGVREQFSNKMIFKKSPEKFWGPYIHVPGLMR